MIKAKKHPVQKVVKCLGADSTALRGRDDGSGTSRSPLLSRRINLQDTRMKPRRSGQHLVFQGGSKRAKGNGTWPRSPASSAQRERSAIILKNRCLAG